MVLVRWSGFQMYTSNDNSVISCFRVVCCCWTMLAYILHAQYSAACSLK